MHHGVTKLKLGKAGVAKIVEENLKKPGWLGGWTFANFYNLKVTGQAHRPAIDENLKTDI
jgi:hypothetical protein